MDKLTRQQLSRGLALLKDELIEAGQFDEAWKMQQVAGAGYELPDRIVALVAQEGQRA